MTILIDDRAGSCDLPNYPPIDDLGLLCRLDSADACFDGNGPDGDITIGVELKSITDLISSAATGRLAGHQIPMMMKEYDVVWLLYYGLYRSSPSTNYLQTRSSESGRWKTYKLGSRDVPYGYIENLLLTLTALGVNIKYVGGSKKDGVRRAAWWLGLLYLWWQKSWDKHKGLKVLYTSPISSASSNAALMPILTPNQLARAKVARQLPGLGNDRAVKAALHFSSIDEMMKAGIDEWVSVDGMGKVGARKVVSAIRETGN